MSTDLTLPEVVSRLKDLSTLLNEGTPGPWHIRNEGQELYTDSLPSDLHDGVAEAIEPKDASLIAAAVNALPDLLDWAGECLVLRAMVARLDEELDAREHAAEMTQAHPTWAAGNYIGITSTVSDVREVIQVYKDYVEKVERDD